MKTITILVGLLLTAAPAAAQSKVYTNNDLGKRTVTWTRTVTDTELAGLKAREFVLPRELPPQPTVVILPNRPLFNPFEPTRSLSEPWSMTTYLGRGYGRGFSRGHGGPHVSGPGIHLVYGR